MTGPPGCQEPSQVLLSQVQTPPRLPAVQEHHLLEARPVADDLGELQIFR